MMNSNQFRQMLKRCAQAGRLSVYAAQDAMRFWSYASLSTYDRTHDQLVSRIMYNVHALEKGLANVGAWAPSRGRKAISNLNDALTQYSEQGFDLTAYPYVEGLSVLQRYVERHVQAGHETEFMREMVSDSFLAPSNVMDYSAAGVKVVAKPDPELNSEKGFHELSRTRVSVREFSGHPIDDRAVLRAVSSATNSPSVCNRQGWRVYKTENVDLIREVLKHQRGFAYEQMPETLLTIAVSVSTFISPVERNQAFVDGGLFSMSLLYGLEAEGLAAVPLNACLYMRDRSSVVRLLEMDSSEEIVMFVAIGDYPESTTVPASDRKTVGSLVRARW